ncbi:MAG: CotH kinase family protein, partial [Planctomycetota bacterium]
WNFPPRANGVDEDFGPLMALAKLVDPETTKTEDFVEAAEKTMDVDEWTRILAGRTAANDWDTYGMQRGKNSYLFRAPDGKWRLLPWDSDLSWGGFGRFGGFGRSQSLVSQKFPAVARFLEQPRYERMFLSRLAFLAERRLEPKVFAEFLTEVEALSGIAAREVSYAAENRRSTILEQLPETKLEVSSVSRTTGDDGAERIVVRGTAPILATELKLAGQTGRSEFPDTKTFVATFELKAGVSGSTELEALDFSGVEVDRVAVEVPAN